MTAPEHQLFTLEEAFARLGQIRGKGCLLAFNRNDAAHIFVEDGVVICATSSRRHSESALDYGLRLEAAAYVWSPGVEPAIRNAKISINEYVLKHAIARDTHIGRTMPLKSPTTQLPKDELAHAVGGAKKEPKLDFVYCFISEAEPKLKIRLAKTTSVVGRDEYCDILVESPQVSRKHCILQATERGVLVKDLDSTNGTFVNGIPLTDGYVNPGDILRLGTLAFSVLKEKKSSTQQAILSGITG